MNRAEVERLADQLDASSPGEILARAARHYPRISFATGFGVEGCLLIDVIARRRLPIDLFTLDTGLLFPETYALWSRLEEKYRVRIRRVRPEKTVEQQGAEFGSRLWERDPELCCAMRKVAPLRAALAGRDAWVSSIRRDQTRDRSAARVVEWDHNFGLAKVNPLTRWDRDQVWAYVRENDVPFNPLHERGYPSIGCVPCTSPVAPGEDPRAGRWRGLERKECGIHARPELPTIVRNANREERQSDAIR
jgi:phosphoadenylyl-sulfate reductase (thioredoxin)